MRCNRIFALLVSSLLLGQSAAGQTPSTPPNQQLTAPGAAGAVATPAPPLTPAGGASAASGAAVPSSTADVVTLSQAASSGPAPAPAPAATTAQPPIVPAIEGNKMLDAAGPKQGEGETKPKPVEFLLVRITHVDDEAPRALMKIHGVSRYVEIGSPVLKRVVTSISDEGVCLEDPKSNAGEKTARSKKAKSPAAKKSVCPHLITFQ